MLREQKKKKMRICLRSFPQIFQRFGPTRGDNIRHASAFLENKFDNSLQLIFSRKRLVFWYYPPKSVQNRLNWVARQPSCSMIWFSFAKFSISGSVGRFRIPLSRHFPSRPPVPPSSCEPSERIREILPGPGKRRVFGISWEDRRERSKMRPPWSRVLKANHPSGA